MSTLNMFSLRLGIASNHKKIWNILKKKQLLYVVGAFPDTELLAMFGQLPPKSPKVKHPQIHESDACKTQVPTEDARFGSCILLDGIIVASVWMYL